MKIVMRRRGGGPKCRNGNRERGINEFIGALDCEFENVMVEVTWSQAQTAAVLISGLWRYRCATQATMGKAPKRKGEMKKQKRR